MGKQSIWGLLKGFLGVLSLLILFGCCAMQGEPCINEDSLPEHNQMSSIPEEHLIRQHIFNFAYNEYDVGDSDRFSLDEHADYLMNNRNVRIRIEGHTDPRGSESYNFKLGKKRAESVRDILLSKGVSPSQIDIISFGKTKLISSNMGESAYQRNRRCEIHYIMNAH